MKRGTLYGIGVGPGDPDLITLKGARVLATCPHVFAPKSKEDSQSLALRIARPHIHSETRIHELLFPMTSDKDELEERWGSAAKEILDVLDAGQDACFLTLGDVFLYSTYIYLLRMLRQLQPAVNVVTIPGITAFSAAAAAAECPLGEGKESVTIVPTADDLNEVTRAVHKGDAVVLMKIGKRLDRVLEVLESEDATDRSVFVSKVGLKDEAVVRDLRLLRSPEADRGYLSVILVRGKKEEDS
ncbi:MAG: precorrin-2 C(20)-methyltransferase [Desulfomonilaceae bacterium]